MIDSKIYKSEKKDERIVGPTLNQICLSDILIIKNWIVYAKLINDKSYIEIYNEELNSNFIRDTLVNQINFRKKN